MNSQDSLKVLTECIGHRQPYIVFKMGVGGLNSDPYAFWERAPTHWAIISVLQSQSRISVYSQLFLQYYMLLCLLSINLPAFQKTYLEACCINKFSPPVCFVTKKIFNIEKQSGLRLHIIDKLNFGIPYKGSKKTHMVKALTAKANVLTYTPGFHSVEREPASTSCLLISIYIPYGTCIYSSKYK